MDGQDAGGVVPAAAGLGRKLGVTAEDTRGSVAAVRWLAGLPGGTYRRTWARGTGCTRGLLGGGTWVAGSWSRFSSSVG